MKRPASLYPFTLLLCICAGGAAAQQARFPDASEPAVIPRTEPGILSNGDWQPLFEQGDSGAAAVFEVPITIEAFPRAIRIGGTGPLMTPDQLIITCAPALDPSRISPLGGVSPEQIFGSTTLPLADITPGQQQVVTVSMDSVPTNGWACGMAFWRSSETDACPYGACAIPDSGFSETPTYEPAPDPSSVLVTEQIN